MKKTKFEPMLAARKTPPKLTFPQLASFKIDGYRTVVDGKVFSRKLKLVKNRYIQSYLGKPQFRGLDGELTIGPPNAPDLIQKMGAVRRIEGKPNFIFRVFDNWTLGSLGFEARFAKTETFVHRLKDPRVVMLEHGLVRSQKELDAFEKEALDLGYEGVMLRSLDGPYKYGRATLKEGYLMKLKRWTDDEMVITGFEEEMENTNEAKKNELGRTKRSSAKAGMVGKGRLGAFLGYDIKTDQPVRVGGGLSAKQREEFWRDRRKLKGKIITYKHFDKTGVKDARRFTIFRAFRDKEEL